jgi:hypothetical protein
MYRFTKNADRTKDARRKRPNDRYRRRQLRVLGRIWANAQMPGQANPLLMNPFGRAASWKLCAKMRLSAFTHIIFRGPISMLRS